MPDPSIATSKRGHTPLSPCAVLDGSTPASSQVGPPSLRGLASHQTNLGTAGLLFSRSQVFAFWLNKSSSEWSGAVLWVCPPMASRLAQRAGGGCYGPGPTLPALSSSIQFFYLTGSNGQAWSIASSPLLLSAAPSPPVVLWSFHGLCPTDWV